MGTVWYADRDDARDDGVYEGEWRDDAKDGHGVMKWGADGSGDARESPALSEYDGEWRRGLREGAGVCRYADGSHFVGGWLEGRRHGEGVWERPDGTVTGCWDRGALARGTEALKSGTRVLFLYHRPSSVNKYHAQPRGPPVNTRVPRPPPGEQYTGPFRPKGGKPGAAGPPLRHGADGVCQYADGSEYAGEWRGGNRNGVGQYVDAVTRERYAGKWVADERCGRGRCVYAAGHEYDGCWEHGLRHGDGPENRLVHAGKSEADRWEYRGTHTRRARAFFFSVPFFCFCFCFYLCSSPPAQRTRRAVFPARSVTV